MNKEHIIVVICLSTIISCNTGSGNKQAHSAMAPIQEKQSNQTDTIVQLSDNIQQVEILCLFFGYYRDLGFIIDIADIEIEIMDYHHNDNRIAIETDSIRNNLISFINCLYIDKEQKILVSEKEEPAPVTDYPYIRVTLTGQGNRKESVETTMYSNMNFNPKFLEFYALLDSLGNTIMQSGQL